MIMPGVAARRTFLRGRFLCASASGRHDSSLTAQSMTSQHSPPDGLVYVPHGSMNWITGACEQVNAA